MVEIISYNLTLFFSQYHFLIMLNNQIKHKTTQAFMN